MFVYVYSHSYSYRRIIRDRRSFRLYCIHLCVILLLYERNRTEQNRSLLCCTYTFPCNQIQNIHFNFIINKFIWQNETNSWIEFRSCFSDISSSVIFSFFASWRWGCRCRSTVQMSELIFIYSNVNEIECLKRWKWQRFSSSSVLEVGLRRGCCDILSPQQRSNSQSVSVMLLTITWYTSTRSCSYLPSAVPHSEQ